MITILTALFTAIAVLLGGNIPWEGFGRISGLGARNLHSGTALPWAIAPMAVYLWAYWQFIGGKWWVSANTSTRRRANLRANRISAHVWAAALAAGVLATGATVALLLVAARLVHLPASGPIVTPPEMPAMTAFLLLAMQSVVAGVTEEAAFRGYMQSMIQRQYGEPLAIVLSGLLFGLLHLSNHPADVIKMLPYYVFVSAVYGALTWAADSILPALVLHSAADIVVLTRWWKTGLPEWQIASTPPPLVWGHGIDLSFALAVMVSLVLVGLSVWAYKGVHALRLRPPV